MGDSHYKNAALVSILIHLLLSRKRAPKRIGLEAACVGGIPENGWTEDTE